MLETKSPCQVCGGHTGQSCTLCNRPTCDHHLWRHHCQAHRPIGEEETALLRTIRFNPIDDAPRLIHADYLEERGLDDVRPNLIRNDVQAFHEGHPVAIREYLTGDYTWAHLWSGMPKPQERTSIPTVYPYTDWGIRRGYIEIVHTSIMNWMKHGPHLLYRNPVMEVFIVDRRPHGSRGSFAWLNGGMLSAATIDKKIWDLLPGSETPMRYEGHGVLGQTKVYRSVDSAYRALGIACLTWAACEIEQRQEDVDFFLAAVRKYHDIPEHVRFNLPRTYQSLPPHPQAPGE